MNNNTIQYLSNIEKCILPTCFCDYKANKRD